jgi:hypothetical protein
LPIQLTQAVIEQWITLVRGKFCVRDIWNEVGIQSTEGKQYLRVILGRLEDRGVISVNGGPGYYRKTDNTANVVDWQKADIERVLPLRFPFGLEQYVKVYPKSIIIVAGGKNAGKTAWMYNFIMLNMLNFPIDLFNSETGPEQMKERFEPLNIPVPAPFTVYERYDHFSEVIDPNRIAVIDYLDMNSEVYLVGTEIDALFRKTASAVVIGLQKPPPTVTFIKGVKKIIDRDLAYGGGFTAKRAVLYVSMSDNKLKLVYVKTPAQPKVNPNNMIWSYVIGEDGVHFENVQRYYGETKQQYNSPMVDDF